MQQGVRPIRIEFHILQSFAVSCVNRDDIGAPKSAIVGGVMRARISSQCWKRQVRLELQNLGVKLGVRTKKLYELLNKTCLSLGATLDQAHKCASELNKQLVGDALFFVSEREVMTFASYAKQKQFDVRQLQTKQAVKEIKRSAKQVFNPVIDALDIALFGRMVAKSSDMSIEAASSFSHAISTHKVSSELDFFTAHDDYTNEGGSAHMGISEFNSATYYRYVSLDVGQLIQSLQGEAISFDIAVLQSAISNFIKALFRALPQARQAGKSSASPWEFARVLVRSGQRLQASFEQPVVSDKNNGYLSNSIVRLKHYLDKKQKMAGSLFGLLGCYEWGEDENYSIDHLIQDLQQLLAKSC